MRDTNPFQVITAIGARPQFIKAAVVSRSFRKSTRCHERLLHTGQHYDAEMSDSFFSALNIPAPTWNLGVGSGSHGVQTGRMLIGIEEILLKERPDLMLVYGDTNSTLAAAIAAVKLNIPVAHVEAGIRSNNFSVPEELNRRMTDHVSSLLFTPTAAGFEHLRREGIPEEKVQLVGDVMYDLALLSGDAAERESQILERLAVVPKSYVLATIHRAENTDDPIRIDSILRLLEKIASESAVVFPMHPRSKPYIEKFFKREGLPTRLLLTPPVGYFDMVKLERNARAIVTDSGGVQKEAFFHKVPCITVKNDTEWPETVEAGCNTVAPPGDAGRMFQLYRSALEKPMDFTGHFYGRGDAANKIVTLIEEFCSLRNRPRP